MPTTSAGRDGLTDEQFVRPRRRSRRSRRGSRRARVPRHSVRTLRRAERPARLLGGRRCLDQGRDRKRLGLPQGAASLRRARLQLEVAERTGLVDPIERARELAIASCGNAALAAAVVAAADGRRAHACSCRSTPTRRSKAGSRSSARRWSRLPAPRGRARRPDLHRAAASDRRRCPRPSPVRAI